MKVHTINGLPTRVSDPSIKLYNLIRGLIRKQSILRLRTIAQLAILSTGTYSYGKFCLGTSLFLSNLRSNIQNGNEVYYVPVEIADQRGNVATYAESLIKLLPALNKKDSIEVRGYNFVPENESYAKIGISIKINGVKVKGTLTNAYYKAGKLVEGDIPAIEWKENALGKKKPSAVSLEAKDEYLLGVLKEQTERLKWVGSNSAPSEPASTPTPKQDYKPAADLKDEDHQDLPF